MRYPAENFTTPRTLYWRTQDLNTVDERVVGDVEEYGCHVINVAQDKCGLGWSYTIGVFDTCGAPELITVGLPPKTAQFALNAAAKLLRQGIDLSYGRHRELIGEVECEFLPVDPKWVEILMGWATWYHGPSEFPVLQAVYPDLENRFPFEEGFNEYFAQPLMQTSSSMGSIETGFWNANGPQRNRLDWKFPDPPHTQVFLSEAVRQGTEAITYVSHDADDGAWQFLGDSMSDGGGPVLCCFHHPIDRDPSLLELFDLPKGWWADRDDEHSPWRRGQHDDEEDEDGPESHGQPL